MRTFQTLISIFALSALASLAHGELAGKDDSSLARIELASSYFQAGKTDIAMEELQKLIKVAPNHSQANELLGLIYMKSGNTQQAETYLKIATQDASNGSAFNNYGMLQCKNGQFEAGMTSFGRALQTPNYSRIPQTLVNGGSCLYQKGDFPAAEKFLLKALEQEPFMPAALYQLSRVYLAENKPDQAETRIKALHQQVQPNAASTLLLYKIAVAQGQNAKATEYARILQTKFSDSAETQTIISH